MAEKYVLVVHPPARSEESVVTQYGESLVELRKAATFVLDREPGAKVVIAKVLEQSKTSAVLAPVD